MASLVVWSGNRWRHVSRSGAVTGWRRRPRIFLVRDDALKELSFQEAMRRLRRGPPVPRDPAYSKRKDKNLNKAKFQTTMERKDACVQTDTDLEETTKQIHHTSTFASQTDKALLNKDNPLPNKDNDINCEDKENMNLKKKRRLNNDNIAQLLEIVNVEKQKPPLETTGNSQSNCESVAPLAVVQSNVEKCTSVVSSSQSDQASAETESHELVISEESVELIRSYIEHHNVGIDLYQFDCKEEYQRAVLYRFNPLVVVERDAAMDRRLLHAQAQRFAGELGLVPARRQSPRAAASGAAAAPDDEAKATAKAADDKRGNTTREVTKRPLKTRQSSVPAWREYSSLEDHAILSWLSTSNERERSVNGNRVWRDFQTQYKAITGIERTWHSLRNRYLRYILPALGSFALPQEQERRLRAKAALGILKSRRNEQLRRRNSMFAVPAQKSASARRLRPAAPVAPVAPARPAAPTRPVARARPTVRAPPTAASDSGSNSDSGSDSDFVSTRIQGAATPSRQTRSATVGPQAPPSSGARPSRPRQPAPAPPPPPPPREGTSSPSYAELTRRFALRPRSTPTSSQASLPDAGAGADVGAGEGVARRTRRLYNP